MSSWVRGVFGARVEFKALAQGLRHQQVNPAYSSQACCQCGYVAKDNRSGNRFLCRHCGHTDYADRVAATNLKARRSDPAITLYTPKERVHHILDTRFAAHLEQANLLGGSNNTDIVAVSVVTTTEKISLTVSGRTSDTFCGGNENQSKKSSGERNGGGKAARKLG